MSKKINQLSEMFHTLCNELGVSSPTILQQKTPEIAVGNKYRDSIIESSENDGTIIAGLLLYLLRELENNRGKPDKATGQEPERLLIVDQEVLGLIEQIYTPNTAVRKKCPTIGMIGTRKNAREDLTALRTGSKCLASTPDRIIDHLRRNNISLAAVAEVVIIRPDTESYPNVEEEGFGEVLQSFNRDLQYIYKKFKKHPKTFLFSPNPEGDTALKELLYRPLVLYRSDWLLLPQTLHIGIFPKLYPGLIAETVFSQQISGHIFILCDSIAVKKNIQRDLKKEKMFFSGSVLLITEPFPYKQEPSTIIFYELSKSTEIQQIVSDIACNMQFLNYLCLTTIDKKNICQKLEELFTMKNSLDEKPNPELIAAGKISMLLEKIRSDKNPEDLQSIRKLIRKTVPISMRMYLAAYLLRDAIGTLPGISSRSSGSIKRIRKNENAGEDTTLFISIGKSRRVYPKDLSRLLQQAAGLESSEILSIKVLDNYSFITVPEKNAGLTVDKLNGTQFRGRTITCDYAKKKAEI